MAKKRSRPRSDRSAERREQALDAYRRLGTYQAAADELGLGLSRTYTLVQEALADERKASRAGV